MLGFFVQNLYAEGTSAASSSVGFAAMIPWILIFVVFYFLLIRPQQKKEKARLDMIKGLKKGDKVTTNGGIIGVVEKVEEKEVKIEVAHGVVISVLKNFVVLGNTATDTAKKSEANTQTHKIKKASSEKNVVEEKNDVKVDSDNEKVEK